MSENTQLAIVEEQALRISELSAALETVGEALAQMHRLAADHAADMTALFNELETRTVQLSEATATIDRLRLHLSQGVEL